MSSPERRNPPRRGTAPACSMKGPISGTNGTTYAVNTGTRPRASTRPNVVNANDVQLVGTYNNADGTVHGFLYQGTTADLTNPSNYQTIDYPNSAVHLPFTARWGACWRSGQRRWGPRGNTPLGTGGVAFLYQHLSRTRSCPEHQPTRTRRPPRPTASGTTEARPTRSPGGYSNVQNANLTVSNGFLVDYNTVTGSTLGVVLYPNGVVGQQYVTHFEGDQQRPARRIHARCRLDPDWHRQFRPGLIGNGAAQYRRLVRQRPLGRSELSRPRA